MASSHMRMRFQSPMLTTSDTAPMVQKCVVLPTARKRKAHEKAHHTATEAGGAGLDSVKRPRFGNSPWTPARSAGIGRRRLFFLDEALLGLLGRGARGVAFHQGAQRLARRGALSHLRLPARDVEPPVGRLAILPPEPDDFLLRGDRRLVVAPRVIGIAD